MNEKPFHLPMSFGDALERLSKVPKKGMQKAKTPVLKKPRASRAKRGSA